MRPPFGVLFGLCGKRFLRFAETETREWGAIICSLAVLVQHEKLDSFGLTESLFKKDLLTCSQLQLVSKFVLTHSSIPLQSFANNKYQLTLPWSTSAVLRRSRTRGSSRTRPPRLWATVPRRRTSCRTCRRELRALDSGRACPGRF